jgi:hypothetical protein
MAVSLLARVWVAQTCFHQVFWIKLEDSWIDQIQGKSFLVAIPCNTSYDWVHNCYFSTQKKNKKYIDKKLK